MATTPEKNIGFPMNKLCKVCGQELRLFSPASKANHQGTQILSWACPHPKCNHYEAHYRPLDQALCSEWIYLWDAKKFMEYDLLTKKFYYWASSIDVSKRIELGTIPKLTAKIAHQWLERLHTYLVFQ